MEDMKFQIGQRICIKGSSDQIGTIIEREKVGSKNWYTVDFNGQIRTLLEHSLEPYSTPMTVKSAFLEGRFSSKSSFSKLLTFKKLTNPVRNNLYALLASRTEFHAYQYKPLLKLLDAFDQRLLIADEVGLGKTIEAGLIMIEQRARNPLDRVLIVSPSSLTEKWRYEMRFRFDEEFEIMNARRFNEFLNEVENEEWHKSLRAIVSLQTLRSRKILEYLENLEPDFDLIVIDEAHHLRNPDTLSNRLGRILSRCADSMLLLTATPIHLGNQDLFNLLKILKPEEFENFYIFHNLIHANRHIINAERAISMVQPDIQYCIDELSQLEYTDQWEHFANNPIYHDVLYRLKNDNLNDRRKRIELQRDINSLNMLGHIINRTRKREVQENIAVRSPIPLWHDFTPEEKQFYDAVTNYVISQYEKYGGLKFGLFVAMNYQRQVASCIQAMISFYKEKFNITQKKAIAYDSDTSDLYYDEFFDNNGFESELEEHNTQSPIEELIRSCQIASNIDSKYNRLLQQLQKLDEAEQGRKILIFSYFKRTLEYLSFRLDKDGYKNVFIHGDVPSDKRQELMQQFKEDKSVRIMLSSEVGSEGLDFQFCHIIVNYDLPWNPMKVEQRIGRVDRFGQQSKRIIIINLVTNDTIEEKIYKRLYERIEIFKQSIGDLEPILGEKIRVLTETLLSSELTEEEKERRIEEISNAIEREKLEQERLETESARLIAFDEFFQQEIKRMTKYHNYISGDELRIFLSEFLQKNFPRIKLKKTKNPDIYILPLTERFIHMLRENADSEDARVFKLLTAYYQNKEYKVTFNSETANKDFSIAFLHNHHPIIQMIKKYYEKNKEELYPISKMSVHYPDQPPGYYFYFIYLVQFTGARPEKRIETVILRRDTNEILPLDDAEAFIGYVKVNGKEIDIIDPFPKKELKNIYFLIKEHFLEMIERKESELKRINKSLMAHRIASINQTYNYKIEKAKERLNNARMKNQEKIIRMHEGRIKNLEDEKNRKINKIQLNSEVSCSYEEIAAGVIKNEV